MPRHYTVKLCFALQNPGLIGFLAEGLKKQNFDVIFPSGIINLKAQISGFQNISKYPQNIRNSQNIRVY